MDLSWWPLLVACLYLLALRGIARSGVAWPPRASGLIQALALGIFITGWSFLGAGSALLDSGLAYLAIPVGASLAFMFGWPALLRMVALARTHRVTTLPGWLTARYGPSRLMTWTVGLLLVIGTLPYLALQFGAIAQAWAMLAGTSLATPGLAVVLVALLHAAVAIDLGARSHDPAERHPGLLGFLALDSLVKLLVLAVMALVAVIRFPAMGAWLADPARFPGLHFTAPGAYPAWTSYLVLAAGAVALLPHMFHLLVVEGDDPPARQATWLFPAYNWLAYALLVPIAVAGAQLGLHGTANQLAIFHLAGPALGFLAYLGVLAAACGMIVVTLLALANMVMIDLGQPVLSRRLERLGPSLPRLRGLAIAAIALLAAVVWQASGEAYLAGMGVIGMLAVLQLAPAVWLGLVWPGLERRAVLGGILAGAAVWLYTAFLPSFAALSPELAAWVHSGPGGLSWLRPQALLGLRFGDPLAHAACWSVAANLATLLLLQRHPLHVPLPAASRPRARFQDMVAWEDLEPWLARFLGAEAAATQVGRLRAELAQADPWAETTLQRVLSELVHLLSGPLGEGMAWQVVQERFPVVAERTGLLAAERDRLQEANQQLTGALQEQRRLAEQRQAFLHAISHDLRLPLTGIMGYAELLVEGLYPPGSGPEDHGRAIAEAAARMERMISELLDDARLEAGMLELQLESVPPVELLQRALGDLGPAVQQRVRWEVGEGLPEVRADEDRIRRVVLNLVSNAVKHSPSGAPIDLMAEQAGPAWVTIAVRDHGPGIAPEDLERVFERFYQTESGRRVGGHGLGLAISRGMVEAHGGTLRASSEPGAGAIFRFTLPVAERAARP